MKKTVFFLSALATFIIAGPAFAEKLEQGFHSFEAQASFDDVIFNLENAIVNRGLVIDYKGHVNAMLERTAEATGSATAEGAKSPYKNGVFMNFCSAALTHEAVAANSENLAICPYVVFAYELHGKEGVVTVGYRRPITSASNPSAEVFAKIEDLMAGIVKESLK